MTALRSAGATGLATVVLVASTARAASNDVDAVLDAPAPPTLPALAHPKLTYTLEYTAASIAPKAPLATGGRAYAWFAHNELELPIESRKWYLGVAHDIAAGAVPGVGSQFFLGNPEVWGRGLWSNMLGLSSGGGLGLVLPLPRSPSEVDAEILQTVRVVRPWDSAYFNDRVLTVRPWFDIRQVASRFILQLRQGLDIAIVARPLRRLTSVVLGSPVHVDPSEHRLDFVARATLYLGFRATKEVGLGLEAWEVYQVSADVGDDARASVAISPSIRLLLGRVAPAFSVLLPLTTPLRGEASSYFAARLNVGFDFDVGWPKSRRE